MSRRQLLAELASLRDSSARMQGQLARALNERDAWRADCNAALDELDAARDELRRIRGELTADRAMPEPAPTVVFQPEAIFGQGAA